MNKPQAGKSQKVNPTDNSAIAVWTAAKGLRVVVLPFAAWWLIETQIVMACWTEPDDVQWN